MRRIAVVSSLLLTLALSSVGSLAAEPHGQHARRAVRARVAQELNLTDEQKARLRAIREAEGPAIRTARETVRARRLALNQAVTAEPVNQSLVDQRVRELGEAQTDLLRRTTALRLRTREVFTPEQREKLQDFREELRERRAERRETVRERVQKRREARRP